MSRNAVAKDAAEESFAGLLEHLTSPSRAEFPGADSETKFTPKSSAASAANSTPGLGGRSGTRTLAPMAKMTNLKPAPDSVPLSYEQALRLHSRRRPASPDLDLPAPVSRGTAAANLPRKAEAGQGKAAQNSQARGPRTDSAKPRTPSAKPQSARELRGEPASESSRKSKGRSKRASSKRQRSEDLRGSPQSSTTPAAAQASAPRAGNGSAIRISSSVSDSSRDLTNREGTGRNASRKKAPRAAAYPRHAQSTTRIDETKALKRPGYPEENKSLAKIDRFGLQIEPFDQRSSTVSVRLTDGEFLRLKERAGESGISVSAYMRSCILDADQLRSQVKQALAQMRALPAHPESWLLPAIHSPKTNGMNPRGEWLRGILRSAALLLGPLIPFRRSA